MARAKRLNAEKVTISIDSDILLFAKHSALDLKMTLSDYIQSLVKDQQPKADEPTPVKKQVAEKASTKKVPTKITKPIVSNEDHILEADSFSEDTFNIAIAELLELHQNGINNVEISKHLNDKGYKTQTNKAWNRQSIKWAIDKYSAKEAGGRQ